MQLTKRSLKRVNFALVVDLLALRQLERLQHQLHFFQGSLQFFDHPVDLVDRLADR